MSAPGDNYYGMNNGTGPGLVVLDRWKTDQSKETLLLEGKLPSGCAMHPDLSFDGKRVVFAYADHTPSRDERQFFLYEIHVDGTGLRQITGKDDDPLAGAGGRMTVLPEDYDPCYLPDGRIVFLSTRKGQFIQCGRVSAAQTLAATCPDSYVRCGGGNLFLDGVCAGLFRRG